MQGEREILEQRGKDLVEHGHASRTRIVEIDGKLHLKVKFEDPATGATVWGDATGTEQEERNNKE